MEKFCKNPKCGVSFKGLNSLKEYCSRPCAKKAQLALHWFRNPEALEQKNSLKQLRRRKRKLDFVYLDKVSKGCSRCPERRPFALQYHHLVPADKLWAISELVKNRGTLSQLKREIDKCILLCGNCHLVEENGDGYRPEDRPL